MHTCISMLQALICRSHMNINNYQMTKSVVCKKIIDTVNML